MSKKKKQKRDEKALSTIVQMSKKITEARKSAGPVPRKVRIHPLDLALIPVTKDMPGSGMNITRLIGIPVEPDCAVRRGHPVAEYEESDGA